MGIHARRRQHMGAVYRHALRLVDRRRIAMVDLVVVLQVKLHGSAIVGLHGHGLRAHLFDGAERAVLHAKAALVLQEHDAIPAGEVSLAALDRHTHLIAQVAGGPHPLARCLVKRADLVVGVGEDDPALLRRRLPVAVPAVDQIAARLLAGPSLVHHAAGAVGFQRSVGFAIGKIARCVALPVLPLATHLADFRPAVALMDRAERRAGFDGLQLLRIADQHDLGAGLSGMGQHAFQLARADHARLVDHQHIARREQVATLSPAMLQAGDGARRNARSAFEIFRRDAGQRHAPDLVAGRFPGLPRHAQHRALSRSGMADHDA